ncbi:hydantoinase B/oxoprolinase family protein [Chloroflexota bacterium]
MGKIDPVTLEIIQNRLTQIGREAGTNLVRAAASLVVVGGKDLGFNIADHLGRAIVYSVWMPRHGTTLSIMLQSSLERFKEKGIDPGDMILVNNPHDGALHVPDLAILAPVHYRGELVAWTGCATHHLDVRGMNPGGFCPGATDWYQEGIVFRPIKIVERGNLREDIFDFLMDNVRLPLMQGLDLKGQIAAINVAKDKIVKLVARYGVDTLKECYENIIAFSEAKTRERIKMVPNGRYEAVEYLDYDKVYTLRCTLVVGDDTLEFDFGGTDPQAATFINSALPCTVANVHNIIMCMLIPDVPANEGCLKPIEVTAPEGTVLSCRPPAPCSGASTFGGWKAQCLAIRVLSQALAKSPEWWRANADWGSAFWTLNPSGVDRRGRRYTLVLMDAGLLGGGARATKDGFDVSNIPGSTNTSIPNVEDVEQRHPYLYISRSMCLDSGGAGTYRGGLAGEIVLKLHDADSAETFPGYMGKDFAPLGFAGGQSGTKALLMLKSNTNISELLKLRVPNFDEIEGEQVILAQKSPPIPIDESSVYCIRSQGGGGYGDPLDRDPTLVQKDVLEGYVSLEKAKSDYKVLLSPDSLDLDLKATEELRRKAKADKREAAEELDIEVLGEPCQGK